jgi:hypothetical protein
MIRGFLQIVFVLGLLAAMPAAAQGGGAAGIWALRAEGRILALLKLHRDSAAPGGWAGEWSAPHFTISSTHAASDIRGSVIRRAATATVARGDVIELTIPRREAGEAPDIFIFRLLAPDVAEFGWKDAPIAPLELARAAPDAVIAVDWDRARSYTLTAPSRPSNPEMAAIFQADQADRQSGIAPADRQAVAARDDVRRARTLALLHGGALRSGTDFWQAAYVFQHSRETSDILLAHTLAVLAVARNRPDATGIAAATLDRYLQRIGQKQIYGTQYTLPDDGPATQEPYDRGLISDALRQALGVETQAEQERQRAEYDGRRVARPPH